MYHSIRGESNAAVLDSIANTVRPKSSRPPFVDLSGKWIPAFAGMTHSPENPGRVLPTVFSKLPTFSKQILSRREQIRRASTLDCGAMIILIDMVEN